MKQETNPRPQCVLALMVQYPHVTRPVRPSGSRKNRICSALTGCRLHEANLGNGDDILALYGSKI